MAFRILTVCTGNICRSPLAAQLLRARLAPLGVIVESAGVGALAGEGMPAPARQIAERLGVTDATDHLGRQLTADHLREADLILAMARDHRRAIVELLPAATRKTFTVRELARIAGEVTDDDLRQDVAGAASTDDALRAAVLMAASFRGIVAPPASPDELDVVDPYGQSTAVYERSAGQLVPAVEATAVLLERAALLAS
ncbi:arsenate reductase/protein-tyrosine-phosphatase family protein [Microbacterium pygmaeum]|uniref:Protein-tyrosine phosphatase n=1 Tax=Microbacterium pygmaeum TaxID=370764 RepID=A0A1G8DYD3_9MICO|nr:hypothetical protein [Microbacterium pygmaeum]SDH62677.1 protein-tyrosine phosphatase [Microbacterium pygmaeum]